MHQLRKLLSWIFAFSSLMCFQIAVSIVTGIVHRHHGVLNFRRLLVPVVLSILGAIHGSAWWTVWKGKRSARHWGIAVSLTYILLPLSIIYY